MGNSAIFIDRDNTLIEDPGYISDPAAVKLLPGVDLALKSLKQAGYLLVVVTNQSGVARGLLSEESLEAIHAELRRQLGEKGVHLDMVCYCPYHPEGTIEKYAVDSELRKPKPGMLLKAAGQLEIDLAQSWMIGDSTRDVEAGQRAGCRTIQIRIPAQDQITGEDQGARADHTARNLVEAARIILRDRAMQMQPSPPQSIEIEPQLEPEPSPDPEPEPEIEPQTVEETVQAEPVEPPDLPQEQATEDAPRIPDSHVRMEILRYVRQMSKSAMEKRDEFSITKLIAGIIQVLALVSLLLAMLTYARDATGAAQVWATVSVSLQVMALTFFIMQRTD